MFAALFLATATLLPITGCVSSSRFGEVEAERDQLTRDRTALGKKVDGLELANRSLESERIRLFEELEDRREETVKLTSVRANLEENVNRLSDSEATLSQELATRQAALDEAQLEVSKLQSTYRELVDDLEAEVQQGAIEIEQLRSGLRVVVADEILFASGSAELAARGRDVLSIVGQNIKKLDYLIDVQGHTDNVKIRKGNLKKRYPSNWELAGARASSVVRLFVDLGIEGERLQAISRAEFHPVASNDDSESRELNRRIEIRLRPSEKTIFESAPEEPAESDANESATPTTADPASEQPVASDPSEAEEPEAAAEP